MRVSSIVCEYMCGNLSAAVCASVYVRESKILEPGATSEMILNDTPYTVLEIRCLYPRIRRFY